MALLATLLAGCAAEAPAAPPVPTAPTVPTASAQCGERPWIGAFVGSTEAADDLSPLGSDIWLLAADGTVRQITDDHVSSQPWIADDASAVLFTKREQQMVGDAMPAGRQLWRYDVDSEESSLVHELGDQDLGVITRPQVSPDGETVVYQSEAADPARFASFLLDLGSGEVEELPQPDTSAFYGAFLPTWSPSGESIAYVLMDGDDVANPPVSSVRVHELGTGADREIYAAPSAQESVAELDWLPSGDHVVVGEQGVESSSVLVVDVQTGETRTPLMNGPSSFTLASDDASELAEVTTSRTAGADLERPLLRTWRGQQVDEVELDVELTYAQDLDLADCSFVV